jgi:NADH-quinone oxidoreductase subunit J
MVLFLFVIMLLGAERTRENVPQAWQRPVALVLGGALALVLILSLFTNPAADATAPAVDASPAAIGIALFEGYVFPFEVTSVLLLVAMIGVVVLRTSRR